MRYAYLVLVSAKEPGQADKVMTERLGYDEDLGFDYTIHWEERHEYNEEDGDG